MKKLIGMMVILIGVVIATWQSQVYLFRVLEEDRPEFDPITSSWMLNVPVDLSDKNVRSLLKLAMSNNEVEAVRGANAVLGIIACYETTAGDVDFVQPREDCRYVSRRSPFPAVRIKMTQTVRYLAGLIEMEQRDG